MNVIQRASEYEFCKTMTDYIIDTDSTIKFAVEYRKKRILEEEYCPDADYLVNVRNLGSFCLLALWGKWPAGNETIQDNAYGDFCFFINGIADKTAIVLASRLKTKKNAKDPGWLTEIREKVTRFGVPEYLSLFIWAQEKVLVTVRTDTGATETATLYTQLTARCTVTLDVSSQRIRDMFPTLSGNIISYSVIYKSHAFKFTIDQNSYTDLFFFRCKNVYCMPETVTTVGGLSFKGNQENDLSNLYGIERKYSVKVTDEYVANSGTIFLQSDYKLWHNFVNAQEVQVYHDGEWYPIIITKQSFEREIGKKALKEVEFTFRMADPEQNNLLEVYD